MKFSFRRFALLLALLASLTLRGEERVKLFEKGHQKSQYLDLVSDSSLTKGKILSFDDGNEFEVLGKLGTGNTCIILKVHPLKSRPGEPTEMALRIPKSDGLFFADRNSDPETVPSYRDFINFTIDGYFAFDHSKINVPILYRYRHGEYTAAEIVPHDFTLREFLMEPGNMIGQEFQDAKKALLEFAATTAPFTDIVDLHMDQMVYDKSRKQWTLLDWGGAFRVGLFMPRETLHAFSDTKYILQGRKPKPWHQELFNEITKVIDDTRKKEMPVRACIRKFVRAAFGTGSR